MNDVIEEITCLAAGVGVYYLTAYISRRFKLVRSTELLLMAAMFLLAFVTVAGAFEYLRSHSTPQG